MGLSRFIGTHVFLFFLKRYRLRNKNLRIFCLPGDHIGDLIFIEGMYEKELLGSIFDDLLLSKREQFSSGLCLDIGANIGNHALYFAERFNRVFSFEPNPIFCSVMRASLALNQIDNVVLFETGLSDKEAELDYEMLVGSLGESHFSDGVKSPTETNQSRIMVLQVCRGDAILAENSVTFESHPEWDAVGAEKVLELLRSYGYDYIYSYDGPINPFRGAAAKLIYRLVMGTRRRLLKIDRKLDKREYLLLIASPAPLAAHC